jgi:hypothetical protein
MGDSKEDHEGDDNIEETHCTIDKVYVFQIPKLAGASTGHSARDWPKQAIWSGRLRVVSKGSKCTILLENIDKEGLFAQCPYTNKSTVEQVNDSSRYFVLRVADGQGHYASVGIGFKQRSEAFNFKVALQDFENQGTRQAKAEEYLSSMPSQDFSIPTGTSITVKLAVAPTVPATKPAKKKKKKGSGVSLSAPPEPTGTRQRVKPGGSKPASSSSSSSSTSSTSSTSRQPKVAQPAPATKASTQNNKQGEIDLFGLDDLTIDEPSPPKQTAPIKTKTASTKAKSTASSEWDQFE